MNSLAIDTLPAIVDVRIELDRLVVNLEDGRILSVPLSWYPRLELATDDERSHWELYADGKRSNGRTWTSTSASTASSQAGDRKKATRPCSVGF